jgi:hypothetical protein
MIRSFSAKAIVKSILQRADEIYGQIILPAVWVNSGLIGIMILG